MLNPDFGRVIQNSVQPEVSIPDPVVPAKQEGPDSSDVCHREGPPGDSGAPHSWPGRRHLADSLTSGWGLRCKITKHKTQAMFKQVALIAS